MASNERSNRRSLRASELPAPGVRIAADFRPRCERLAASAARARGALAGPGAHGAIAPAAGFDFVGYRAYRHGDDPRAIDWALRARSRRLAVRLTRAEAEARWSVVVDTSASMGAAVQARDAHRGPVPGKLQRAVEVALAWVRLGWAAGARVTLSSTSSSSGPSGSAPERLVVDGPAAFERAVRRAETWLASGSEGLGAWLATRSGAMPGRSTGATGEGRLILVGDLFDLEPAHLARLRPNRRRVALAQVLSPIEIHPPAGVHEWIDPESAQRVVAGAAAAAVTAAGERAAGSSYGRAFEAWRGSWEQAARRQRVALASHPSSAPFEAWFR